MNRARREILLGSAAIFTSASYGQVAPARPYRLGFLSPTADPWSDDAELRRELQALGLVEGANLTMISRRAHNEPARLPALARELVDAKVDAIVTSTTLGTRAALGATRTIPIVAILGDPVDAGVAMTYSSPGRNATGLAQGSREEFSKGLEVMRMMLPKMREIVVFMHPALAPALNPLYQAGAADVGMAIRIIEASAPSEVMNWLESAPRTPALAGNILDRLESAPVAQRAIAARMALSGYTPQWVEQGGLMAFRRYHRNAARRIAALVAAVLRGEDPARLPFELPDAERLLVNRATARTLGLSLPNEILMRAESVVD